MYLTFIPAVDIDSVIEAVLDSNFNSSFAVRPWHGFLWELNGRGVNHTPELPRIRRQDLSPQYLETGSVYAMKVENFKACKSRFCYPWKPVIASGPGFEIDSEEDLRLCQQYASFMDASGGKAV